MGLLDAGPDFGGMVPSSFATQMALATGQLKGLGLGRGRGVGTSTNNQGDRGDRESSDRLSRLVLARMKTLEEGFADVVKEMREMRSAPPSSQDSDAAPAAPVKHALATRRLPTMSLYHEAAEVLSASSGGSLKNRIFTRKDLKSPPQQVYALALETYNLKEQLTRTREELATALYQHDAAVRVIARLTKERDEARDALSKVTVSAGGPSSGGDAMVVDAEGLPEKLVAKVEETKEKYVLACSLTSVDCAYDAT